MIKNMIQQCSARHISFAREPLLRCGMKGCENENMSTVSDADIDWFYMINPSGLAIDERDLNMILKDDNMPQEVKDRIREIFPAAQRREKRSLFGLR